MISVIIPVYNVEKYLVKCIESVRAQTYTNIEIILVDDGSSDTSGKICDIYENKDSRIVVIHKQNGGLSDARNKGLEIANGEYIAFIDSDDYIHPRMYEILLDNLIQTKSNLSICSFQWIDESEDIMPLGENIYRVYEGNELLKQLIVNNLDTVVSWNKLYKKALFQELCYNIGRVHEDEFIIHKILYQAQRAVYTECKLYIYVKRKNSIVSSYTLNNAIDAWEALEDRCIFLIDKNKSIYCSTRHQQLAMGMRHYLQIKQLDNTKGNELYLFYRPRFIKILKEVELWENVSKLDKKKWITFSISKLLFYLYCKKNKLF